MSSKKFNNPKKTFNKRNFSEVIELLVPSLYVEDDIATFGKVDSLIDEVIESHINIANNIGSILDISAGTLFPAMDSISAISPFFIKQTNYTEVTPYEFFRNILIKDEKNFSTFNTSGAFKEYVDTDLIPKITPKAYASIFDQDSLIQDLGCLEVSCIDKAECCNICINTEEHVYRTLLPIPTPIGWIRSTMFTTLFLSLSQLWFIFSSLYS